MNKTKPETLGEEPEDRAPTDLRKALAGGDPDRAPGLYQLDRLSQTSGDTHAPDRESLLDARDRKTTPCCYSIVSSDLYTALAAQPKAKAQWSDLTSTERREFISWMDSAKQAEAHRRRIEQAARCLRLASDARDVSFLAEVRGDWSIDKICVPLGLLRFRGKKPKSETSFDPARLV